MKDAIRVWLRRLALVLIVGLLVVRGASAQEGKPIVKQIQVVGNQRITTGQVMGLIRARADMPFNAATVQEDARRLVDSRWFRNVNTRLKETEDGGVIIVYEVFELPNEVQEIVYDGARLVKVSDLEEATGLRKGMKLNPAVNQNARQAILRKYQEKGYYWASCEVAEGGKPSDTRVVFKITEGPIVRVSGISFSGIEFVTNGRVRTQITSSRAFLNLLGGVYNPMMIDEDCRKLEEYFKSFGYHDVRVSRELIWEDNYSRVRIVFHVEEGSRYRLKAMQVDGAKTVAPDELLSYATAKEGEFYDHRLIQAGGQNMKNLLGYKGIDANVDPKLTYIRETAEVAVNYQVQERPPSRVGEIHIIGNRVTRDNVIRRQVPLYPGQVLTYPDLRRAEANLARLNIFEMNQEGVRPTVEVLDPDGPNEFKTVLVSVEETRTGSLLFGAGINSDAGLTGSIVLNERNFDLFRVPTSMEDIWSGRAFRGAGQEFRIEAVPGNELQRYTISWREPYLFDSQVSLGTSGYYYTRRYLEYDEQRLGTRINLGRRFWETFSLTGGVRAEQVGVLDVLPFAPADYLDVQGNHFITGLRGGIAYDDRDSYLRPTEGQRFEIGYEQIVGDFSYPLLTAEASKFFTLYQRADGSGRHVLAFRSQVGYAGPDTPVFDRFFAGGFRSLRGFSFRGVGPDVNGFKTGGDFLLLNSVEYQLPILANDQLYLVGFVDTGTVEENVEINTYRVAAGVGLRIVVPMMGPVPIALDFGFPIVKADTDVDQLFSFWVGFFN